MAGGKKEKKAKVDKNRGRGTHYTVHGSKGKIKGRYDSKKRAYKKENKIERKKKKK